MTARRTAARGTAVQLSFAGIVGVPTCDVTATAIATLTSSTTGYGVVGLNYINMQGNSVDSYWSSTGYVPGGSYGSIASNGNITLNGSSTIYGDAHPGAGKVVSGGTVSGSTAPLTSPLSYPNGSAGTYATSNSNAMIPPTVYVSGGLFMGSGSNVTLPGGNYYLSSITMSGGAVLNFSGPATVYCYGTVTMSGNVSTNANLPGNFNLVMVPNSSGNPPGGLTIGSSAALYANIYAPQSDIILSGSGAIYGSVLGKSVTMNGTSAIHYDLSLGGSSTAGAISLVK